MDQVLKLVAMVPAMPGSTLASPVWSSSDSTVAVVGQDGVVFGLKSGVAIVSVTSRGVTDATRLVVRPSIRYVRFDADTLALGLSQGVRLPYHAVDSDGNVVDIGTRKVEWATSAPAVVPLTADGGVVGRTLGSADVRLSVDGKASYIRVQVKPPSVSSVKISPAPLNTQIGAKTQLAAAVTDASGTQLQNRVVSWNTSNPGVATVDGSGVVTAVSAGTAKITAICENKRGNVAVSVTQGPPPPPDTTSTSAAVPAASISVSVNPSALLIGQSAQANATVKDANANVLTDRTISWTSSDSTIANVSATGLVSAMKAGSAVITGSVDGVWAHAVVVVSTPALTPASISVSTNVSTLKIGEVAQATAVVKDVQGTVIPGAPVTWGSAPSSVATISVNGAILGRAPGTATITASLSGLSQSVSLVVADSTTPTTPTTPTPTDTTTPPPAPTVARVAVTLSNPSLTAGATTQASAVAYDANGQVLSGSSPTWSSSNAGVASVSQSGAVSALAAGTAAIRATIDGQTGSATVTVTAPSPITGTPIYPGQSIQSAVNASPSGTTFILKPGTHVNQSVVPKDGDRFIGEPGAILDGGGTVVSAFSPGTTRPANVTIRGLEIRNYGPASPTYDNVYGVGAVTAGGHTSGEGTRGWVVDSNYIHDNRAMGVRIGHAMTLRGNRILHNSGPFAFGGIGDSTQILGNELGTNNYLGSYSPGFGAGGFKIVLSIGVVIRGNWIHHNQGYGAWGDIANRSMTFDGNTVEDNTHAGIFYEISYGCRVTNNVVRRNGLGDANNWLYPAGILIAHSPDCEVAGNTVSDNVYGIIGIHQTRTDDAIYGPHVLERLWVHDNTVTQGASGYAAGVGSGVGSAPFSATANNRFDRNRYSVKSTNGSPFAWADGARSWTAWRGYGHDAAGSFAQW